jgi:hypothetical protein
MNIVRRLSIASYCSCEIPCLCGMVFNKYLKDLYKCFLLNTYTVMNYYCHVFLKVPQKTA